MSIRMTARVFKHSKLKGVHRLMMLAIADSADDEGRAWPSVATLAAKCGVSPRAGERALAKVRNSGEIAVMAVHPKYRTTIYRIVLPPADREGNADPGVHAGDARRPTPASVAATPGVRGNDPGVHAGVSPAPAPPYPSIHQSTIRSSISRTTMDAHQVEQLVLWPMLEEQRSRRPELPWARHVPRWEKIARTITYDGIATVQAASKRKRIITIVATCLDQNPRSLAYIDRRSRTSLPAASRAHDEESGRSLARFGDPAAPPPSGRYRRPRTAR